MQSTWKLRRISILLLKMKWMCSTKSCKLSMKLHLNLTKCLQWNSLEIWPTPRLKVLSKSRQETLWWSKLMKRISLKVLIVRWINKTYHQRKIQVLLTSSILCQSTLKILMPWINSCRANNSKKLLRSISNPSEFPAMEFPIEVAQH